MDFAAVEGAGVGGRRTALAGRIGLMTWAKMDQPGRLPVLYPGHGAAQARQLTASAAYLWRPGRVVPVWVVVSAGLSPVLMVGGG